MVGPTRYTMVSYGAMVTCEPRMSAYAAALQQAVTPGCTVVDIGAGPGVFSLLACRYGASSVIAVEPDESVQLLRQLAADNGCADRITVFQGLSRDLVLPGKADVIVSDIRGCLPLFETHIATIVDARQRLLAPGGTLIPARDALRIALVESPDDHAAHHEPWSSNRFDLNLVGGARFTTNSWSKVKLGAGALLSDSAGLGTLDYYSVVEANLESSACLKILRPGTAHGLLVWFDAELATGIGYSNAPGEPSLIYGQVFLPLQEAVEIAPGDHAEVEFTANLVDGSYIWGWNSSFHRQDRSDSPISFRQSTFQSRLLSPQSLKTRAGDFVPSKSEAHAVDRLCLSLIDGNQTLAEIADRLQSEFPARFGNVSQALNHVAELTNRYR